MDIVEDGRVMFIGREKELATLERLYCKPGFQFPAIYGRRRVGKTTLISRFAQDKPTVFFTAIEGNLTTNLRLLSAAIRAFEAPDADPNSAPVYRDLYEALDAVFRMAASRRLVFVIDEYPYLAKTDPSVSSMLQGLIDRYRDGSQLYLILCGSSLSFMREQLLDDKSPLYGRRTAQIELSPFDFFDALGFFPDVPSTDALQYYAMAGGVPLYLRQFDPALSLEENVCEVFLQPESLLYDEPTNLIKQEVQKAAPFNAVIQAIAEGRSQNNEIATAVGIQTSELTYYLKGLRSIGLVSKEMPVVAGSRRAVYRLSDNLFRFWYRFVLPNRTAIERGMQRRVLRGVLEGLSAFCGPVFEDVCAQWLWMRNADGSLPVEFGDLGRWWGNDPLLREEAEIDLVGIDGSRTVLVGECKWRNEDLDRDVVETLEHRSMLVQARTYSWLYAFSKSGFTQGAVDAAASYGQMRLVSFEEMCGGGAGEAGSPMSGRASR